MSEHKFKIRDKVKWKDAEGKDRTGVLTGYVKNEYCRIAQSDSILCTVEESALEPVSSTDMLPQEEIEALFNSIPTHSEEREKLEKAKEPLDQDEINKLLRALADGEKDKAYQRGYKDGMNAVIVNVERFMREIKP